MDGMYYYERHSVLFKLENLNRENILAILLKNEQRWNPKAFWSIILASVIPFGTFYIDRKYLAS